MKPMRSKTRFHTAVSVCSQIVSEVGGRYQSLSAEMHIIYMEIHFEMPYAEPVLGVYPLKYPTFQVRYSGDNVKRS